MSISEKFKQHSRVVSTSVRLAWGRLVSGKYDEWDKVLDEARNNAGFHWRDDVYFKKLDNGTVQVTFFYDWNYNPNFECWFIPPNEWASIVSTVSKSGETSESYEKALQFHKS